MKAWVSAFSVLAMLCLANAAAAMVTGDGHTREGLKVPFVMNVGQTDSRVKFYAKTGAGTAYVTRDGAIVYDLPRVQAAQDLRGWSLKEDFVGARVRSIDGDEQTETRVSYFIGNDAENWKRDIPTYRVVSMGELYRGIHLKLRAQGANIEKVFSVSGGAHPEKIRVRIAGARSLRTNKDGELEVSTGIGTVVLSRPVGYQINNGRREHVRVSYAVTGKEYRFKVGPYDKTRELVIDPVLQATYLGGGGDDFATAIAVSGPDVYVAGSTTSTNFPKVVGGAQPSINTGRDNFVALLTSDLRTLSQATYFGGSGNDDVAGIAVKGTDVYVAGTTSSADLPATTGGAQPTLRGGTGFGTDGYVARFTSDLKSLTQATYLGGRDDDAIRGLAVPASSLGQYNVFVAGVTTSPDFPGTAGGIQPSGSGILTAAGNLVFNDGFVAVLSSDLTSLTQATYLGGTSNDQVNAIALSPEGGFVYVAGQTSSSSNFPRVSGGGQENYGGGLIGDGFVALLTSDLTTLLQSSFVGGSDTDTVSALAVSADAVYVAGETASDDLVGTIGHAQPTRAGYFDGFIARFNTQLTQLQRSTYLGGGAGALPLDRISGLALSGPYVYVAGTTGSTDFPATRGAQETFGGVFDGFAAALTTDLQWATFIIDSSGTAIAIGGTSYLGGSGNDAAVAIAVAGTEVYVAGSAGSTDFPGTGGGAQVANAGGTDAFVAKLSLVTDFSLSPIAPVGVPPGGSASTTVTVNSLYGFHGEQVKLYVSSQPNVQAALPAGFTASFGFPGDQLDPPANGSISTTVTVGVAASVAPGTYTLWLVGLPGTPIVHSARLIVTVLSPLQVLINSITVVIQNLNLPPQTTARLLALLQRIPPVVSPRTPSERASALQDLSAFISEIRQLESRRTISPTLANELRGLANQAIGALGSR